MEQYIDIVFDGPPGNESGRFVEVENEQGASIHAGDWIDRGNGLWALRIKSTVGEQSVPENWVPFALRPREVGMLIGAVTHRLNKQLREYEKPKQVERRAALEAEGRADVAIKAIQATADLLGRLRATADHHRIPHGPERAAPNRYHEYVAAYTPPGGDRICRCGHPQRDPRHFAPHAYEPGHGRRPFFGCALCGAAVEHAIHQVER